MNWSEEKIIRLVDMRHIIKIIVVISPNRFSNIFSYINKEIIKHIFYVLRVLMDKIHLNYLLHNVLYLTIFCVNDVIDDASSLLYVIFFSIEFMLT